MAEGAVMAGMVLVRWLDSAILHDQVDELDLPTPSVLETAGWLSKEVAEYIVVSRDHAPSHDSFSWRSSLAIPRAHIRELIQLAPTKIQLAPTKGFRVFEPTGNCPVRQHTADGSYMGRCDHSTFSGVCHLHGDVSRWLGENTDLTDADDRKIDPAHRGNRR